MLQTSAVVLNDTAANLRQNEIVQKPTSALRNMRFLSSRWSQPGFRGLRQDDCTRMVPLQSGLAGGALLLVVLCLGCSSLFWLTPYWLPASGLQPGSLAGVCVEWGKNWAGQVQVGVWWEASHLDVVKPNVPIFSALQIHCVVIPWSAVLPTRGIFIYVR